MPIRPCSRGSKIRGKIHGPSKDRGEPRALKRWHRHKKTSFSRSVRGSRLGRPIRCSGLSVHCDGPHPSSPGRLRKVMDLPGPGSEHGTRTNLLFTMSCRTGGRQMPSTNLFPCERLLLPTFRPIPSATGDRQRANPSSRRHPEGWWSRTGSNRRHPACKAGALPAELRPRIVNSHQ